MSPYLAAEAERMIVLDIGHQRLAEAWILLAGEHHMMFPAITEIVFCVSLSAYSNN